MNKCGWRKFNSAILVNTWISHMIWPRQSYPDLGLYYGIIISRVKKIIVSIHSIRPHLGITISVCKLEPLQKKATKMVKEFQKHVIWETAKEMGVLNWETRRLENIKSWLYSIWRMARKTRIRFLSRPKGKHWWFSLQKRKKLFLQINVSLLHVKKC